jgi:hypothetical protein
VTKKVLYFYFLQFLISSTTIDFIRDLDSIIDRKFFTLNKEEDELIKSIIKSPKVIKEIRDNLYIEKKINNLYILISLVFFFGQKYFIYIPINLIIYLILSKIFANEESSFFVFLYFSFVYLLISALLVKIMIFFYKIPNNYKLKDNITVIESFSLHNKDFGIIIYTPIIFIIFYKLIYYIYDFYLKNKTYKEIKNKFKTYLNKDNDKLEIPTIYENYKLLEAVGVMY